MTTLTELQNELAILKTRCQYLEQENHQKDGQIAELNKAHQSLKEMKRSASVHSFHPTMALDALPVEFEAVKKGLKDTVDKCTELLSHLDIMTQAKTPEVVKNRDFQTQTSTVSEVLEERTTGLRTSVNVLNQRLDNWRDSHIFHMQSVQHETFQDVYARYQEAQNEIDLLRNDNLRLNHRVDEFREIIQNLTAVNETKDAEAKEHIQVLRHQNLAFTEDFQNERKDREAAQSRVAELEDQVGRLQREIRQYADHEMEDIRRRRDEALERCRREYQQTHPGSQTGNLYQTDSSLPMDEEAGEDTVDGLVIPPSSTQQTKSKAVSSM